VDTNRKMRALVVKDGNEILPVRWEESDSALNGGGRASDDDYLSPVLEQLTDSELRKIFSGLCGGSGGSPS